MRRRTLLIGLLPVLLGGGLLLWFSPAYLGQQQVARYSTAVVERGSLSTTVNATGTVNAVSTVQVGTQVSGTIQKLLADFNSVVQEGDVIAQIDPALLATRVSQARALVASAMAAVQVAQATVENTAAAIDTARANAESARANVEKARIGLAEARRVLERSKEMGRRALIAQGDLDTAQATYDTALSQLKAVESQDDAGGSQLKSAQAQARLAQAQRLAAQAQVEQAQAALQAATLDLQHTTIRAPVRGIVVSRNVDVGQTVAASLQAPTLFLIAQDLTQMQLDTNVSEADIGRIQVGQSATFTVDAYANLTFSGTVRQVRNAPITVQNVVTYNAVVQVDNAELRLKPGMTANVSFLVAERRDVLKVPNAALRFQPEGAAQDSPVPDSQAPARSAGSGRGRGQEMQQRLTQELGLNAEQQTRLAEILQKTAQQGRALREEESEERRRALRREMQAQTRSQIQAILTPAQQQQYSELLQAREATQAPARPGRIWLLPESGAPEARQVTLGLANDTHTEVLAGELSAGQQVITGLLVATKAAPRSAPPGFATPGRSR